MRARFFVAAVCLAAPMWAHHSFAAEFDQNKTVILQGTITRMEWVNPHAYIHLAVKGPDGAVTDWRIEGNTPNSLLRAGLTKKTLEAGTEVAVRGYLSRSGEKVASGSSIIFKSGTRMSLGSEAGSTSDKAAALEWISSDEEIWKIQIAELRLNNSQ